MITEFKSPPPNRFTTLQLPRRQVCLPDRILFLYRVVTHHLISTMRTSSLFQCFLYAPSITFVNRCLYDFLSRSSSARRKVYVVYFRSPVVGDNLPRRV